MIVKHNVKNLIKTISTQELHSFFLQADAILLFNTCLCSSTESINKYLKRTVKMLSMVKKNIKIIVDSYTEPTNEDCTERMEGLNEVISGLIYVLMHEFAIYDYLENDENIDEVFREFCSSKDLDAAKVRYDLINGKTKSVERVRIMQEFNDLKSMNLVITTVTTAIDLDCDYVYFYEFTSNLKQMIGQAYRGLGSKCLDLVFEITMGTIVPIEIAKELQKSKMLKDYNPLPDVLNPPYETRQWM